MSETAEATTPPPTPGAKRTALEAAKLGEVKGKTFVITGAYSGIGVETAKALLAEGGSVVVGGRNQQLLDEFVEKLKEEYDSSKVDGAVIDLADLATVKTFAEYVQNKGYQDVVLICNAGVMNTPPGQTKDGYETQMGVNVIGHFLLAKLLVKQTRRQVWVSSLGHTMVSLLICIKSSTKVRPAHQFCNTHSTRALALILTPSKSTRRVIWRDTTVGRPTSRVNWATFCCPRNLPNATPSWRQLLSIRVESIPI